MVGEGVHSCVLGAEAWLAALVLRESRRCGAACVAGVGGGTGEGASLAPGMWKGTRGCGPRGRAGARATRCNGVVS
eukprot:6302580-Amphidinium_carterae.2